MLYLQNLTLVQSFKSSGDVQLHMIDREHTFMDEKDFEEFQEFYNFDEVLRKKAMRQAAKFGECGGETLEVNSKSGTESFKFRVPSKLASGELLLPSGKIAGKREFAQFYNQNFTASVKREEVKKVADEMRIAQGIPTANQQLMKTQQLEIRKIILIAKKVDKITKSAKVRKLKGDLALGVLNSKSEFNHRRSENY